MEGHTIRFVYRYAESKPERLSTLAAELVQLTPDVLFTWSAAGVLAAQQATTILPIVAGTADLITPGIIANLAQPGGKVTGADLVWPRARGETSRSAEGRRAPDHARGGILCIRPILSASRLVRDTIPAGQACPWVALQRLDIRTSDRVRGDLRRHGRAPCRRALRGG